MASGSTTVADTVGEESEDLLGEISSSETDGEVASKSPNATRSSTVIRHLFSRSKSPDPLNDITNRSPSSPQPRPAADNDTQLLILQEVRKANSRLDMFSDRLEGLESRLASVEDNQLSSVTPSSSRRIVQQPGAREKCLPNCGYVNTSTNANCINIPFVYINYTHMHI